MMTSTSIPEPLRALFAARGVSDIRRYLDPSLSDLYPSEDFPGMGRAVDRILESCGAGQPVGIHGDADPDGMTGSAVLAQAVTMAGGKPEVYIPDRMVDGHGISDRGIDTLIARGVSLILSADTGTTSYDAARRTRDLGVDLIVTDHHEVPVGELGAFALLNPKMGYQFPHLAGVGVALKVALAIAEKLGQALDEDCYALAAIGSIADMVPMREENRPIVKAGLDALVSPRREGLRTMMSGLAPDLSTVTEFDVGKRLLPWLGCPRSVDGHNPVYALLTATDATVAATALDGARRIRDERNQMLSTARKDVFHLLDKQGIPGEEAVYVVEDVPNCAPLALGYVAGRLEAKQRVPVILLSRRNGLLVAEARGPRGTDFPEAFGKISHLLIQYGGHKPAAGFTADPQHAPAIIAGLRSEMQNQVGLWRDLAHEDQQPEVEWNMDTVSAADWSILEAMRPFGKNNEAPRFLHRGSIPSALSGAHEDGKVGGRCLSIDNPVIQTAIEETGRSSKELRLCWTVRPGADSTLEAVVDNIQG